MNHAGVDEREDKGAVLEDPYRYLLWRRWGIHRSALFIMLNPSTADGSKDDPTIRRCRAFAKAWGYGGLEVVNLFAYRATNPASLVVGEIREWGVLTLDALVGPKNDASIVKAALVAGLIVLAWGEKGSLYGRDRVVLALLARTCDRALYCLGTTTTGHPRHPLYVRGDLEPQRFP